MFLVFSYLHEMFVRHLAHLCKTARSTSPGEKYKIPQHPINK